MRQLNLATSVFTKVKLVRLFNKKERYRILQEQCYIQTTEPLLYPREIEVLRSVRQGLSIADIAPMVECSPEKVKQIRDRAWRKIKVRNRFHFMGLTDEEFEALLQLTRPKELIIDIEKLDRLRQESDIVTRDEFLRRWESLSDEQQYVVWNTAKKFPGKKLRVSLKLSADSITSIRNESIKLLELEHLKLAQFNELVLECTSPASSTQQLKITTNEANGLTLQQLKDACDEAEHNCKELGLNPGLSLMIPGNHRGSHCTVAPGLNGKNLGHYGEETMVFVELTQVRQFLKQFQL